MPQIDGLASPELGGPGPAALHGEPSQGRRRRLHPSNSDRIDIYSGDSLHCFSTRVLRAAIGSDCGPVAHQNCITIQEMEHGFLE